MMINCKKAATLQCIALDRPLTRYERVRLKVHRFLCRCPVCCAHPRQLECFEESLLMYRESMSCCEPKHSKRLCMEARIRICKKLRDEMDVHRE